MQSLAQGRVAFRADTGLRLSRQSAYGVPNSLPFTSRLWRTATCHTCPMMFSWGTIGYRS